MELYDFQRKSLGNLLNGKRICCAGTGAGKTSIALHWAKAQGKPRVLVVTTSSKRDSHDWENEADAWFPSWRQSLSSFFVISWQGLAKWWSENKNLISQYAVIFDECLPADTKVKTDTGEKEIADIKVGDRVLSYNHDTGTTEYKTVYRIIKKPAPEKMMCLHLNNGTTIISTSNHPHYTQDGYKKAEDIKTGDTLYELHDMWETNVLGANVAKTEVQVSKNRESILLQGVQVERCIQVRECVSSADEGGKMGRDTILQYVPQANRCENDTDKKVPDIHGNKKDILLGSVYEKSTLIGSAESAGNEKEKRVATDLDNSSRVARGEWKNQRTTEIALGETLQDKRWMDNGATSNTGEERTKLPDLLQVRCRQRLLQNRDRVRWGKSPLNENKSKRQEKRKEVRGVRVESIKVLELRDIKRLGLYRDPDYVYCIDVADNHNFFANGILTHNCHSAKAGISSQRGTAFLKIAAHTNCWTGYTATPGDCWMDFYAYFCACNFVRNKTAFRMRFCNIQTYKGFPEIIGYREQDTLKDWWERIADTVDISEMLAQLPEETHKVIKFDAPKGYKEVLKTRMSREGEFLDTTMGLCCYLRQMCVDNKRLAYIADFVENLGDRAVLFYNFIKEGEILEETIKKVLPKGAKVWRIDGRSHDIPTEETCGKRDVVLVQWQAGAMGLNLQFMQYWVSVSPNYSWTISTQARGRIKRIGQKKNMFFLYFVAEHTIEESIYECLHNKRDFAEDAWLEGEI